MVTNVDVPTMGESITEAVLLEWLKADGDRVEDGEPICVLETDKANVELPAPGAGVLHRLKHDGETVRVGESIARLESPTAEPQPQERPSPPSTAKPAQAPPPSEAAPSRPSLEDVGPAVRRLIAEHQIDPTTIQGTGPRGRLTKEDVLSAIESQKRERETAPPQEQPMVAPEAPPAAPLDAAPRQVPSALEEGEIRRRPMSKIRRRIADNLVAAQRTAAMLTTFNEIDMTAVLDLRIRHGERFRQAHGVSLGLMPFFARACTFALQEFPIVNARLDGDDIVYHAHVHLGIAVSTERGLVVPVLRQAETMSMARIEAEIERRAAAAREGKLALADLSGGTFTITNGGVFGSLLSTPILNPPQSAILGMHTIQKRPVAVDERIEIRPMMYVALSYDHRLIDGREAVLFLMRIKALIEDPTRLLLEV